MHVTTVWWLGTCLAIGLLLVVDLFISGRSSVRSTRQSVRWVMFYVAVA